MCIAAILDGDEQENRQRLEALRKIPSRYRGIWVPAASTPVLPDGWEQGIQWVIADPTHQSEDWARMIQSDCQNYGIPCFLLPGDEEQLIAQPDVGGMPHHPFKAKFNLHESSPYGGLMRPKPSTIPVRSSAIEVDVEAAPAAEPTPPLPDSGPCPGAEIPAVHDEEVSPPVPPATAMIASCPDVVDLPASVVVEAEDETPGERFVRLDQEWRSGIRACVDAGFALLEIRDAELWREGGYASWSHYSESFLETSRSYVNRLISHAVISRELLEHKPPSGPWGEQILPVAESQTRPLKKLFDGKQRAKAWRIAVKRADGLPTAKIVMDVVSGILGDGPPTKPRPSRGEQRLALIKDLRHEALSRGSWERIAALINLLEKLETPKTHTK